MLVGIYETVLYCADIAAATAFYRDVVGLRLAKPATDFSAVFRLSPESMLLIFDPAVTTQSGRGAPPHGAVGPGHVAFRMIPGSYSKWKEWLTEKGLIESEVSWDAGGRSLYVRDPAGNSVEFVEGQVWPG